MAQITGVEPGLGVEHLAGGLGAIEIALHHLGAAGKHQTALPLLQGAAAIGINDFELGSRQRPAGTTAPVGPAAPAAQHWAGFGEAVAHQQFDADGLEKSIDVLRQGPTAADGGAQMPARQLFAHRRPQQAAGQGSWRPTQRRHGQTSQALRPRQGVVSQITPLPQRAGMGLRSGQGRAQQLLFAGRHSFEGSLEAAIEGFP